MATLKSLYEKYGRPVAKALGYTNDRTPEEKRALQQKALNQASNVLRPVSRVAENSLNTSQRVVSGILRASPRAARSLDLSFGEAIGKPVSEIVPTNKFDKFFLGDQPVVSAQTRGRLDVSPFLQKTGLPPLVASKLGTPLALTGLAIDLNPLAGGSKGLAKEAASLSKIDDLAKTIPRLKKLGLSDEAIAKVAPRIVASSDAKFIEKGLNMELARAKRLGKVNSPVGHSNFKSANSYGQQQGILGGRLNVGEKDKLKADIKKGREYPFKYKVGDRVNTSKGREIVADFYIQDGQPRYITYPGGKKGSYGYYTWANEKDIQPLTAKSIVQKTNVSGNPYTKENVEKLTDIYKKQEVELSNSLANRYMELDTAEAGKRLFVDTSNEIGAGSSRVEGYGSTFPDWMPPGTRTRKMIDRFTNLRIDSETGLPIRPSREGNLQIMYDAFIERVEKDLGHKVSVPQESVIKNLFKEEVLTAPDGSVVRASELTQTPPVTARVKAPRKKPSHLMATPAKADTPLARAEQAQKTVPPKTLSLSRSVGLGSLGKDTSLASMIDRQPTPVNKKVHILNYLNTPSRVLEKIGLGKEAKLLDVQYRKYLKELPQEIDTISKWANKTTQAENVNIFKSLDGQLVSLTPKEVKIAGEIKTYLKNWADRLGLPGYRRISSYITHIFEKDFIKKEFPDEIANLISDKVPGSVYDPFVEQRLGKQGYIEDTWRALEAYVKRATRKVNMDHALEQVKAASEGLEQSQFKYVKTYADRINLRPTDVDTLIDNFIKITPVGYKLGARPTASITRTGRRAVYRGTLGLNVATTLKNLSQGANTYAKLGEKYTATGYINLIKNWNSDELKTSGILLDGFIQDRQLFSVKKIMTGVDKGLFYLFETAEKINRGAAYYGAKAKALAEGKSLDNAIDYARQIVKETQFTFGSIDTPIALQSDMAKLFTQFMSYSIKQGEFLSTMASKKDVAGLTRWLGASLLFVGTVGKMFGMEPKDLIPSFRFGSPPVLAPVIETGKASLDTPDKYGRERDTKQKVSDVGKTLIPFVPGGTQIKKSYEGINAFNRGASVTSSGNVRYPIEQTSLNRAKTAVFGQYSTPEARDYFANDGKPLSEKQSAFFKEAAPADRQNIYERFMSKREQNKLPAKAKESLSSGKAITEGDTISYMTDEGNIKSIDLAVFNKDTSGTSFEALENKDDQLKALRDVYRSNLLDSQKKSLIKQYGKDLSYEDIEYDSYANATANMRAEYFIRLSDTMEHSALLEELAKGRKKSISGKQLVTGGSSGTLGKLHDAGIISSAEYKILDKLKDGKAVGTVKRAGGSSGGSKSKASASKAKKPVKVASSVVTAPKLGTVKAPTMPTFSRRTSRTTLSRPTVKKPRISGSRLANMR